MRIYSNWRDSSPSVSIVPLRSSVVAMATCPITSRMLLATKYFLCLWETNNNHLVVEIEVQTNSVIKQCSLLDDYIAYSTSNELKVLKLTITDQQQQQQQEEEEADKSTREVISGGSGDVYGTIEEDEYFFECVFDNTHVDSTLNIALLLPKY